MRPTSGTDRRVRKTQRGLREALESLIHEKSYHSIVVKDILERADVGRTAFYTHFSNKDALLASGIEHILYAGPARQQPIAGRFAKTLGFSLPFFEHVAQCRHTRQSAMSRRGRAMIHQHLRQVLTRRVREDLEAAHPATGRGSMPSELLAEFIVGTFLLVLTWWVESNCPVSPLEADDMFIGLVLPTLGADARP